MTENVQPTEIRVAWLAFANGAEPLFAVREDNRPLDQFLSFRNEIFSTVKSDLFLQALDEGWNNDNVKISDQVKTLLVMELKAFPLAMEVAQATQKPQKGLRRFFNRWLDKGSVVTGSVKDILDEALPPLARGALISFQELFDIYKD